jgi:hypothetical protein
MRGLLHIRSARSPYLRAGLSFPAREPVPVDIRDLNGERLLELARDPVLSIAMGDDDGTFRPMPAVDESVGVEQAQMMIDSLAAELPPRGPVNVDPVADELSAIAGKLAAAGFISVDDALEQAAALVTLLAEYELGSVFDLSEVLAKRALDSGALVNAGFASVGEVLEKLVSVENELRDANVEGDDLAKKVAALETEVAALKAKPADDGKPAKAKTPPATK